MLNKCLEKQVLLGEKKSYDREKGESQRHEGPYIHKFLTKDILAN